MCTPMRWRGLVPLRCQRDPLVGLAPGAEVLALLLVGAAEAPRRRDTPEAAHGVVALLDAAMVLPERGAVGRAVAVIANAVLHPATGSGDTYRVVLVCLRCARVELHPATGSGDTYRTVSYVRRFG